MKPKNPVRDAFEKLSVGCDEYGNAIVDSRDMHNFLKQFDGCELVKEKPLPRLFIRSDWRETLKIKHFMSEVIPESSVAVDDRLNGKMIEIKIEEVE